MLNVFKTVITALITIFAGTAMAAPKTVTVDKARTVYLQGEVGVNAVVLAEQVESFSRNNTAPIWIVINSPGGSVFPGLQLVEAMRIAQARGVTIKCVTTLMAASMAFTVFANCNERYAFTYSMLLFHPMRSYSRGGLTSDDMIYEGRNLRKLEQPQIAWLQQVLQLPAKEFFLHYNREKMWTGEGLKEASPKFLTIINDLKGAEAIYSLDGF